MQKNEASTAIYFRGTMALMMAMPHVAQSFQRHCWYSRLHLAALVIIKRAFKLTRVQTTDV